MHEYQNNSLLIENAQKLFHKGEEGFAPSAAMQTRFDHPEWKDLGERGRQQHTSDWLATCECHRTIPSKKRIIGWEH